MNNELRKVKEALIDLSFITNNRKQASTVLRLKKAVNELEQSMNGELKIELREEFYKNSGM